MPTPNERDQCKRKTRYSTSAAADAALKKINPSRKLNKPTRIYKCPVCSGWHLTSKRQ